MIHIILLGGSGAEAWSVNEADVPLQDSVGGTLSPSSYTRFFNIGPPMRVSPCTCMNFSYLRRTWRFDLPFAGLRLRR